MLVGIGITIAIIVIFLLLRIQTSVEYSDKGFLVFVKFLFLQFKFPRPEKKAKEEKTENIKEKPAIIKKMGGNLPKFTDLFKLGLQFIGKTIKKIRIDELTADIRIAGEDPFAVAMKFGGAASAVGILLPLMENNLNIIKKQINVNADFGSRESTIYFLSKQSISVWKVFTIVFSFAYHYRILQKLSKKETKN